MIRPLLGKDVIVDTRKFFQRTVCLSVDVVTRWVVVNSFETFRVINDLGTYFLCFCKIC